MEQAIDTRTPRSRLPILEDVMHLASLASDRHAIDSIMNTVRGITARLQVNDTLSKEDQAELEHVRHQLTEHLLRRDPVRTFTEAELEQQLAAMSDGDAGKRDSLWRVIRVLVISFLSYPVGLGIMYLVRMPNPTLVAGIFASSALYIGLIWIYWSALSTFTPSYRNAYRWICMNMAGLALVAASSTIFNAFPRLANVPILSYGGLVVYISWAVFMIGYEGMRQFALGLAMRTWLVSWRNAGLLTLALCALSFIAPAVTVPDELALHIALLPWVVTVVYGVLIVALGIKVARRVTSRYAQAVGWFTMAYVQATVISLVAIALIMFEGPITGGAKMVTIETVFTSCGISLVLAGYMFSRSVGRS